MIADIWEPLVAIGTLALATATFVLVRATFTLAKQGEAEVLAQWRPVLIVRQSKTVAGRDIPAVSFWGGDGFLLTTENVGRGPALDIRATVLVSREDVSGEASMAEPPGVALGHGDTTTFRWPELLEGFDFAEGSLSYFDLSYKAYATKFAAKAVNDGAELVWQRVDADPSRKPPVYG